MKNNLVKKVAPWVFAGLGLIGSGCGKTYNIDGNRVSTVSPIINKITEYKGDSLTIKYLLSNPEDNTLMNIKINGISYTKSDTLVYNKARQHYEYLINKIDSIDKSEELKGMIEEREEMDKKIAAEKAKDEKRIDFGLKAFEK
jgi:hypothetical protein